MAVKRLSSHVSRKATPQRERIPGDAAQVANNAGGYVYALDKWQRLDRFLVLGTDGGTYYVGERALTRDNAAVVEACLAEDAARTVARVAEISDSGRAPKNDPAVLALALAASSPIWTTRRLAYDALARVCRIPTHLFHFLAFAKELRGWSRGLRGAVARWYQRWTPEQLAFEVVKYQARDGWSNRDALRLAHARYGPAVEPTLRWACGLPARTFRDVTRKNAGGRVDHYKEASADLPAIIEAFEAAKTATPADVARLVRAHGLTREMVPSAALNDPEVWAALLPKMPLTALIRNLAKMTSVGLLAPLSDALRLVTARIDDPAGLRAARVHPMAVLNALRVYEQGHGDKGKLTWTPVAAVVDALDAAFYAAFGNVAPTGKRLVLALDVSGSMGAAIAGTALTCREAAAALALVTAAVEPNHVIVGFTAGASRTMHAGYGAGISHLAISPRQRLNDVVRATSDIPFGGTDCALPALWAREQKMDADGIIIVTDSETWAGHVHPKQALASYRAARVAGCRQVVVGMTATGFTIADPADLLSLDVVGFDTATPQAVSDFVGGAV